MDAYFKNISQKIKTELLKAKKHVKIQSAYFTDNELLKTLIELSTNNILVELIISDENSTMYNSTLDFFKFMQNGGLLYIANKCNKPNLLHNKYCVIDETTLITGSYNWTKNARNNFENIIILEEKNIIEKYSENFSYIKEHISTQINKLNNKNTIYSGFYEFDHKIGGFQSGNLICLAGLVNVGISEFLLSMAVKMQSLGYSLGYISSHTKVETIQKNILKIKHNIPIHEKNKKIKSDLIYNDNYYSNIFLKEINEQKSLEKICSELRFEKVDFIIIDNLNYLLRAENWGGHVWSDTKSNKL